MDFIPKSREQKLIEALYPYFGDLAYQAEEDAYALRVCRHLLALKSTAIQDIFILPFIDIWHRDHPEENSLTNDELLWALTSLELHITSQLKRLELELIGSKNRQAKLRVINGGLSENPDRPYWPVEQLRVV